MDESEVIKIGRQIYEFAGSGSIKIEVVKPLIELCEQYPDNPIALLYLGFLYKIGFGVDLDLDKAIFYLEKARSLDREQAIQKAVDKDLNRVQKMLGDIYEYKGLLDKALICYSEAYRPEDGDFTFDLDRLNEKYPTYAGDTIKKLQEENNSLKEENKRLREENKNLHDEINFAPGGSGYVEAKEHFESLQS